MEKLDKSEKLTDAQARVMTYIGKGWEARVSHGSAIEVNGKRVCNADTMMALSRRGLAQRNPSGGWVATESGRDLVKKLSL